VRDVGTSGDEQKVVNVLGRHDPSRPGPSVEKCDLIAFEVEVRSQAEAVALDRVARVPEAFQVCERRFDLCADVSVLDFDEHQRQQPTQRRLATAKDSKFVSLYVALDEVDALELEIIESPPLDLNGLVSAHGPIKARESVGGAIADQRNMQFGVARLVGECEWMEVDIVSCARNRSQRPSVLRIRLESVDETRRADDAGHQRCVRSPARADVNGHIARSHELLCQPRSEVSCELLPFDVEARAKPRRGESAEANDCTEQVDAMHARPLPRASSRGCAPRSTCSAGIAL
jgi:hypothetical protein